MKGLRTYFGEPVYRPTDKERAALVPALDTAQADSASLSDWSEVRDGLRHHH